MALRSRCMRNIFILSEIVRLEKYAKDAGLREKLSRDFRGHEAAKRLGTGSGELHVPEVVFQRRKLNSDVLFAIARAMNRNHAAFSRLRRVVIDQNHGLADDDNLFKMEERPVAVHRLRVRLYAELFTRIRPAMHCQRHIESYANRPPAFFASKVKKGHF